jgi:hypothetical protein
MQSKCVVVSWGFIIDKFPWNKDERDPAEWVFQQVCGPRPEIEIQRIFAQLQCGVDYVDTVDGRKYYVFAINSSQFVASNEILKLNWIENIQWRTHLYNFCEIAGIEWKEPSWHMLWH